MEYTLHVYNGSTSRLNVNKAHHDNPFCTRWACPLAGDKLELDPDVARSRLVAILSQHSSGFTT